MKFNIPTTLTQFTAMPMWGKILCIALIVIEIIATWKIFVKAGEPGWKAIIPIYSTYILFKITYGNGWRFLLTLIPIAGIVFTILFYIEFAKSFNKGAGYAVGLFFLTFIFSLIFAFNKNIQYVGNKKQREPQATQAA